MPEVIMTPQDTPDQAVEQLFSSLVVPAHLKCAICGWTRFVQHKRGDNLMGSLQMWVKDLHAHVLTHENWESDDGE